MEIKKIISNWKNSSYKNFNCTQNESLDFNLPKPGHELIQKFNKALFHYLWGSDIQKIKKNTIIQDYNQGGLKMIDYREFMLALKSTWIRRLLHSSP